MRHFLSFLVSFFYVLNVVAAPAWFPEGIQTKGSSTIGEKSTANSSAVLDVRSTTKGMLPPRMTTAQRTAIATPATGLMVYDTDTLTVWQYNGTGWVEVGSGGTSGAQYNVIANYGFEATSYSEDWTASGGTLAAAAGSNILFGAQSATWDASASTQTLSYASQAIGEGYKSNNCEGAIFIKTPSGTATHTVQVWDGTNVLASVTVYSTTTAKEFSTGAFPCPSSGNWQLRIVANADEPLIAVDNAYLGLARNVAQCGVDTPWVSYTPSLTTSGGGAITLNATSKTDPFGRWRRVGDSIEIEVGFKNGSGGAATGSAGTMQFSRPSDATIDPNKAVSTSAFAYSVGSGEVYPLSSNFSPSNGVLYNGGILQLIKGGTTLSFQVSDIVASFEVRMRAKYPVVGWTASQCVTPNQQRAPKVTVYTSGSGTHTWSNGVTYAEIEMVGGGGGGSGSGTASSGAGGAGGNTTFAGLLTANGGAGGVVGTGLSSGGSVSVNSPAVQLMAIAGANGGGTQYDNLAAGNSGGAGASSCRGGAGGQASYSSPGFSAKANSGSGGGGAAANAAVGGSYTGQGGAAGGCIRAQIIAPSGTAAYAVGAAGSAGTAGTNGYAGGAGGSGEIIVTEYFGYTTAILANSVSTGTINGEVIHRAQVNTSGASACSVQNSSTGFIASASASSTVCTLTLNPVFSADPTCIVTRNTSGSAIIGTAAVNSSTSVAVSLWNTSGTIQTGSFNLICMGPR